MGGTSCIFWGCVFEVNRETVALVKLLVVHLRKLIFWFLLLLFAAVDSFEETVPFYLEWPKFTKIRSFLKDGFSEDPMQQLQYGTGTAVAHNFFGGTRIR